jgi:endonuclease/exonuclease/phosphatase family metal-dependent hydrolase
LDLRKEKRIMVGDFNLFKMSEYEDIFKGYNLSYNFKKYQSFKEGYENGKMIKKDGTLDYMLIPNNYEFKLLEALEEYLSDHNALYAEVE